LVERRKRRGLWKVWKRVWRGGEKKIEKRTNEERKQVENEETK
jgi:hypothetical protein